MSTKPVFIREAENPLITPEMIRPWLPGFRVACAFNAGAAVLGDETLLLLRVSEKHIFIVLINVTVNVILII